MLDLLRKNSRSFLIYLMFAIIIVVFAFTFGAAGPGQACGGGGGPGGLQIADLAEVDGTVIDTAALILADEVSYTPPGPKSTSQSAQEARRDYLTTRFGQLGLYGRYAGATFGRDLDAVSPVKAIKLMDELVESKLTAAYAKKLGMAVSDREMSDRLALITARYVDEKTGKFDEDAWANFMRRLATTPAAFERFVKDEILRERVIALTVGGVTVTDAELDAQQRLSGDKVKVEYVAVDPGLAASLVKVTDAEIATWLGANAEKAEKQYNDEKDSRFTTPKQWTLRALKIEAPDPATSGMEGEEKTALETERANAKAKAAKLLEDVKAAIAAAAVPAPVEDGAEPVPAEAPADVFSRFATDNSDHASKDNGGRLPAPLDAKGLARWPFGVPVQTTVQALGAGQLSEVVEVPTGFWLFYVDAVTEPVVKTLDEAKVEIARSTLQAEKAPELVKTLAAELLAEAKKDPSAKLEVSAAALNAKYGVEEGKGFSAKEARPFARLEAIADGFPLQLPFIGGLGRSAALVRAAFAATAEAPLLDGTFALEPGENTLMVARFLEAVPAEPLTDDAKKELRETLTFEKQRLVYRGWYESYLAAMIASGDVEYTSAWLEERRRQEEAFRQAGGVLKEDAEKPTTAANEAAPKE